MGLNVYLIDPLTNKTLKQATAHTVKGAPTYAASTQECWIMLPYGSTELLRWAFEEPSFLLQHLYGFNGRRTAPRILQAWLRFEEPREKRIVEVAYALELMCSFAVEHPNGVWTGDFDSDLPADQRCISNRRTDYNIKRAARRKQTFKPKISYDLPPFPWNEHPVDKPQPPQS